MRGPHHAAQRLDAAAMPSARGKPRAAAQRPLPSMMMATCAGASDRSGPSVAGAAALDMEEALDGENFFFPWRPANWSISVMVPSVTFCTSSA